MTNDPLYEQMREKSWRRKLDPEEEARLSEWLASHPEAQPDWESETALNEVLTRLPHVPVASNFTTRVVAAAQREADANLAGKAAGGARVHWWWRWLPKAAVAAAVLMAGLLSYNHLQSVRRAEYAQSLATLGEVASLPSPEALNDFDAIAALSSAPTADEELLKLMQ